MIRDEVIVVGSDRSPHEPFSGSSAPSAEPKGAQGHDRKKDSSSSSSINDNNNGNVFTGIIDFFAGLGKPNKNKGAADADRADVVSTTPLTAHDSDAGEEYCVELHEELRDNPGPLSVYPPVAGGQQRRRTSQPVAIKRAPGTRAATRAPARRPQEPAGGGNVINAEGQREGGAEGARETAGDDAESKINAWQRRRMSTKRESFTVREDTHAREM